MISLFSFFISNPKKRNDGIYTDRCALIKQRYLVMTLNVHSKDVGNLR